MKKETLYLCEYCGKGGFNKKKMQTHEDHCPFNPSSKSCRTCSYYYEEMYQVDKSLTSFTSPADIYGRLPKCKAGIGISTLERGKRTLDLRSHCEYWFKKLSSGEKDVYDKASANEKSKED